MEPLGDIRAADTTVPGPLAHSQTLGGASQGTQVSELHYTLWLGQLRSQESQELPWDTSATLEG